MKNTKKMKNNIIILSLGIMLLGGCSREDGFPGGGTGEAVSFTAGIHSTRTTDDGDAWVVGDAVGIYMLPNGGDITVAADVLADNVQYNVTDPATGTLAPASGTPIFFPLSGTVNFMAYYPYGTVTAGAYNISVVDQADPAVIDVLYAKTTDMSKDNPHVSLTFGHVLSKVTLDVTAGTGFVAADISGLAASAVVFGGMPVSATLALQDGTLKAGTDLAQTVNPLKDATPSSGSAASFTVLLVPQAANVYTGRTVAFTVGGQTYTWMIPETEIFEAGNHYNYPVTVQKTGITVGDPEIIDWTIHENETGTIDQYRIVPEANSYMVEPDGMPIMIPVSQANRVLTADGLGATNTGLGGVTADNYTVELVWGDTPVGTGGVLVEIGAKQYLGKGYVYVQPGVAGNAVVAIRDKASGTIKWSWHIWVTEPVGSATDTETGLTWMDRNLGATANTPLVNGVFDQAQWAKTFGLYYQWGRKDAFPGSDGTTQNQTYYIGDATTGTTENLPSGRYVDLPDMVRNPLNLTLHFIFYYGSLKVIEGNKSWGENGSKTIYDPCPPGWRVPETGKWSNNSSPISGSNDEWDAFANKGYVFNGVNGVAALGHFYPALGFRSLDSGEIWHVGISGGYWSATSAYAGSYAMLFQLSSIDMLTFGRTYGYAVRCVAE